jgi:hypothetical protein
MALAIRIQGLIRDQAIRDYTEAARPRLSGQPDAPGALRISQSAGELLIRLVSSIGRTKGESY